jgi:arginyl-tRNA synthetase
MNIYKTISDRMESEIKSIKEFQNVLTPEILSNIVVEAPKIRGFGDFSTNVAMVLAKPLGKSPRDIAGLIVPLMQKIRSVSDVSVAGPGFINIRLRDDFILESGLAAPDAGNRGGSLKIDLDYGGYNIGKDLHIGHMRTTVVGDAFNRMAKSLGHRTKSYNHMGDWGRPMGLIIAWILEYGMPGTAEEINLVYPASSLRAKEDEAWLERAKKITADLQAGDKEYRKIYDAFASVSLSALDGLLSRLNILPFDENRGERLTAEYVPDVQRILEEKNLLVSDQGAKIIPVKSDSDTAPMPPVMWRSSAGAQTYAAADLTGIYYRAKTDAPDAIVYFTDSRQNLHFDQIFRAARLAGLTEAELQHIGFGSVAGADGKPFKTRDGNVPSLNEMIDMVVGSVRARVKESGKELSGETIETIALAALKFNDLMHDVRSDYVFDAEKLTSFEGRTGPYILYTAVRLNSVIKKAGEQPASAEPGQTLHADERNLLLGILDFDRVANAAFDRRAPDMLANYVYDLCQNINSFYHNCPVLRDDVEPHVRSHRLRIVRKSLEVLSTAIELMGLRIPEEM